LLREITSTIEQMWNIKSKQSKQSFIANWISRTTSAKPLWLYRYGIGMLWCTAVAPLGAYTCMYVRTPPKSLLMGSYTWTYTWTKAWCHNFLSDGCFGRRHWVQRALTRALELASVLVLEDVLSG
jgi:hypothetical protein